MNWKEKSYIIGLAQTDGNMYRRDKNKKKGRFSLSLSYRDRDIIKKISELIDVNFSIRKRKREVNFGASHTVDLSVCDYKFRDFLETHGVPYGKKSDIIARPQFPELEEIDYVRGLYDGDGSLGIVAQGFPYISITTASEELKNFLCDFIFRTTGRVKRIKRNKRDNIYNIVLFKEDAAKLVSLLYYDGAMAINRKREKSELVKAWIRPADLKKRDWNPLRWLAEEDAIVMSNGQKKASVLLGRTVASVSCRKRRLNQRIRA
jgi:hypothetical protein